jgi:hypothetical protein
MTHSPDTNRDGPFIRIKIRAMKRSGGHLARAFDPQKEIKSRNSFSIKSEVFGHHLGFDLNYVIFAQRFYESGENRIEKFRVVIDRR